MERSYNVEYSDVPISYFRKKSFEYDGVRYKRISGYENYYISDRGEVISIRKGVPRILQTWPNQYGHLYTRLTRPDGSKETISIHREVANAFVPNRSKKPIVRHKDDDPVNNFYENLEWGTQSENMRDCRMREREYHKSVYCFELDREFRSCADAADFLGLSRPSITHACNGKAYTAGGMHFCYFEEKEERAKDLKFLSKYGNFKPVIAINCKTGVIQRYSSRKEASEKLGVSDSGISNVLAGRIRQTGGWIFKEGE